VERNKQVKAVKRDLEEKESALSDEISSQLLKHYKTFITTYDNISSIEHGLKDIQGQLSQYGLAIENLKSKTNGLAKMNQLDEWQTYINQGLDENWELDEDEDEEMAVFHKAIPYGK
jgi:uncharacterized phage infection (PIP) family protein YhgE